MPYPEIRAGRKFREVDFKTWSLKCYSSRHWFDMDPNTAEENGSHSLSVKKERDYETKTNDVS